MFVYRLAKLVLVAATLLGYSLIAQAGCSKPSVRREWRSLASHERAQWIAAVKVKHPLSLLLAYLTLPCPVSQCITSQLFFGADF